MSNRSKKIFLALLGLFLAGLCIFVVIQVQEFASPPVVPDETLPTPDPLQTRLDNLAARYKNGGVSVIDISTTTTFSWDKLYIFGQYTDFSDLFPVVGVYWINNNCSDELSVVSSSDGYTLLVFSNKGTVVHCLAYLRKYDFYIPESLGYAGGYSPQEALFVFNEYDDMIVKDNK